MQHRLIRATWQTYLDKETMNTHKLTLSTTMEQIRGYRIQSKPANAEHFASMTRLSTSDTEYNGWRKTICITVGEG